MHLFLSEYLVYLILNILACLFLFASIMGIPGNPDDANKKGKFILDFFGKLLVVAYRGIPILTVLALIAFFFHYIETGKILSYLNFTLGGSMVILLVMYYQNRKSK